MFVKYIPNLLTFSNLSLGLFSILELFKQNYLASAMFILFAALIDRYDGKIARRLNVCSEFGKELDSLADLVSFGIAPALLIYMKFNFNEVGVLKLAGIILLVIYVISGAHRLALFNIKKFEGTFRGIPITVAGLVLSTYALVLPNTIISLFVSAVSMLILSYLMVSNIKIKKI